MEIPTYIDGNGHTRQDLKACLVLQICPVTGGLPTKMRRTTFDRLCHAKMDEGRNSYCSQICQAVAAPAELTFIGLPADQEVSP